MTWSLDNPDALEGATDPTIEYITVEGTTLYAEIRGSGPPVLIIGAADEDAEFYRGIADRLSSDATVITYDRRGTGRSGRENWPTDSTGHADDAAAVLGSVGSAATVLSASAGGIVGLRLALRHPESVETLLCFEPGVFHLARQGGYLRRQVVDAIENHLKQYPGDWSGASDALGRAAVAGMPDADSLFSPPTGKEWFAERAGANAESLIVGDIPLTGESFDLEAVTDCASHLRFAYGSASLPVFAEIATRLAETRGVLPDRLEGLGHSLFYHPDQTAAYVRDSLQAERTGSGV